jgi:hypothetical protein
MEFPKDIFTEIVSFTGATKTKQQKVFEEGELYYKWRNDLMIFKVLKRTKCFITLQVVEGSSPYHKTGEVFRKKVFVNKEGNETLHIIWEDLYPSDKINSNYSKKEWNIVKPKIIYYCENKSRRIELKLQHPEKN